MDEPNALLVAYMGPLLAYVGSRAGDERTTFILKVGKQLAHVQAKTNRLTTGENLVAAMVGAELHFLEVHQLRRAMTDAEITAATDRILTEIPSFIAPLQPLPFRFSHLLSCFSYLRKRQKEDTFLVFVSRCQYKQLCLHMLTEYKRNLAD